jgi:hypothetical protein
MKNKMLLPRIFRPVGWVLFPLAMANLISRYVWDYDYQLPFLYKRIILADGSNTFAYEYTEEFAWIFTLVTLFMIAFARQKVEDEYVQSIRLHSLLTSIYIYGIVFILVTIFGDSYFFAFDAINIVPPLLIFILVFNYRLFLKPRIFKSQSV